MQVRAIFAAAARTTPRPQLEVMIPLVDYETELDLMRGLVERVGAEHAMNHRVDVESLREMRRICLNIVCAASSFDAMYQPRLPLEQGEANGRGV
jgi:signal transduction protein with GAF and PtsI domain